ncbi:MAG: type II toxin-antitoxin system RelE/ParE family toxin, partial [Wolbachia endosymbiont of Menacanthus eurysternus]|nr:type II toxin-antitoxin system RelE/ParE family toxin [Wolbachia endosymbiont of Menacanthus eurysternus]
MELSKRYAKKDFPALSEETKSAIKKAIEEELKVKPTKVGKPLRGKLRGYRRLKFDKYRLIYHVNISGVLNKLCQTEKKNNKLI